MTPAKLSVVKDATEAPPPDMSYEYLDRQRIMRRNWAETHIAADRRAALPFWTQLRRGWR